MYLLERNIGLNIVEISGNKEFDLIENLVGNQLSTRQIHKTR